MRTVLRVMSALALASALIGGCDANDTGDGGEAATQLVTTVEVRASPGDTIAVDGNFMTVFASQLEAHYRDAPIELRSLTPSQFVVELPTDATSHLLDVSGPGLSARVGVVVEPPTADAVWLEREPNGTNDEIERWESPRGGSVRIVGGAAPDGDVDRFRIDPHAALVSGEWLIRVEGRGGSRAYELSVTSDGQDFGRLAGQVGESVSMWIDWPDSTAELEITLSVSAGDDDASYALEVVHTAAAEKPARSLLFLPSRDEQSNDHGCVSADLRDVDGDGEIDVVCGEIWHGDGSAVVRATGEELFRAIEASWCDIDRDGRSDVLLRGPGARTHRLLRNTGATWEDATLDFGLAEITGLEGAIALQLGDIDVDGRCDLFAVSESSPPQLYRGGRDVFEAWQPWEDTPFQPGTSYRSSLLADIDGNGDLEWLLFLQLESETTTRLVVLDYDDEGVLSQRLSTSSTVSEPVVVAPAFVNNDGFVDLVVAESQFVYAWLGTGELGRMGDLVEVGPADGTRTLTVFDANSDGSDDILVSALGGAELWLTDGASAVWAPTFTPWRASSGLGLGYGGPMVAGPLGSAIGVWQEGQFRRAVVGGAPQTLTVVPRLGGSEVSALVTATLGGETRRAVLGWSGQLASTSDRAVLHFSDDATGDLSVSVLFADGREVSQTAQPGETLVVDLPD